MLYVGQQIEVEPGIFKYITQYSLSNTDNGDGSSLGLNDNGQFVAMSRLADTATSTTATPTLYVVLQIPAPGTGVLALLGLTAISRRRRR